MMSYESEVSTYCERRQKLIRSRQGSIQSLPREYKQPRGTPDGRKRTKQVRSVPCLKVQDPTVGKAGLMCALILMAAAATASASPSDDASSCLAHIAKEEANQSLPAGLLEAIGIAESGRMSAQGKLIPWPWTVNANGYGHFFDSKEEAIEFVQQLWAQGVTVIDIGCMQVNHYFHPDAFESLESAFDPTTNVAYAAQFLKRLHAETGDWDIATRYYHSRTPALGQAYAQRVTGGAVGTFGAVASLSSKEKATLRAGVPDLMAISDRHVATVSRPHRSSTLSTHQGLTASTEP